MNPVAENSRFYAKTAKTLKEIMRFKAWETLSLTLDRSDITLHEVPNPDDFIYGQMMGYILIHGRPLRITFKIHYQQALAYQVAGTRLGLAKDSLDEASVNDFMREYCNLAGGYIVDALASSQISMDISIPLITDGFDEVWFSDRIRPLENRDFWQLKWPRGTLTCTCTFTIRDINAFADLQKPQTQKDAKLSQSDKGIKFL